MKAKATEAANAYGAAPEDLWPASDSVDDMSDTAGEAPRSPRLVAAVAACDSILTVPFREYDRVAVRQQRMHRWIVRVAAVVGTFAVVVAITELALGAELQAIEIAATLCALIAVVLGVRVAFQREWLLNRYRAERLRELKFAYLIDPAAWSEEATTVTERRVRLEHEAADIARAKFGDLDTWLEQLDVHQPPDSLAHLESDTGEVDELLAYYRLKRLGKQGSFYARKAAENDRLDRLTHRLPQYAFFGSIVAALANFLIRSWPAWSGSATASDATVVSGGQAQNATTVLVLLAATLPLIGSCIRTMRGSREFARNRARYHALHQMLVNVDGRLRELTSPDRVMRELWYDEQAFEAELREWLRLMRDVEWYG
jgi:hypothetical protein